MKKKAFTLVEIMIALIIVSVVVSLSIVTFQKTIEANNDKICRQNLKMLQGAIEIYTLENNALPTTLSRLTPEQIHLAYKKVIGKPKENRLAGYFNNLIGIKPLFADLGKYYGNDPKVRRCPADKTTATGESSYILNPVFTSKDFLENHPDTMLLSDTNLFHKKDIFSGETYRIGISPAGEYGTINQGGVVKGDIYFDTDAASVATTDASFNCANYNGDKGKCKKYKKKCEWDNEDETCKNKLYQGTPIN